MSTKQRGFTLIELLIVIAIIAMLAGITVTVVMGAAKKKHVVRTLGRINQVKIAIEQFRLENNQYPWDLPVDDTDEPVISFTNVAKELNPSNLDLAGIVVHNMMQRDYLVFSSSSSFKEIDPTGKIVDPWGSEYQIHWNLEMDKVVIWSNGPDGVDDTLDDAKFDGGEDGFFGDDVTSMK